MVGDSGLGMVVDLGIFDRMANIESTPAEVEIFNSKGSFFHVLLGAAAGCMPAEWTVLGTTLFGGYELSKVEGGKPFSQIAGAIWEFAIGMGIASLFLMGRGSR